MQTYSDTMHHTHTATSAISNPSPPSLNTVTQSIPSTSYDPSLCEHPSYITHTTHANPQSPLLYKHYTNLFHRPPKSPTHRKLLPPTTRPTPSPPSQLLRRKTLFNDSAMPTIKSPRLRSAALASLAAATFMHSPVAGAPVSKDSAPALSGPPPPPADTFNQTGWPSFGEATFDPQLISVSSAPNAILFDGM